jgi:putative ABC transport system permease protein
LVIVSPAGELPVTVCGLYSDATNGGKTAKATFIADQASIMWNSIYIELAEGAEIATVVQEYTGRFAFAKVANIAEFQRQTLGTTIDSLGLAATVSAVIAPAIALLITLLFVRMLVAREHYAIAVMKAVGFTSLDIRRQFFARVILLAVLGVVLGTLLVLSLGEALTGALINSLGVASFKMQTHNLATFLLCPLTIGGVVLAGCYLATQRIKTIKVSESIKE